MGRKEDTIICDTFRILSQLWIMEDRMLKAPHSHISQESPLRKGHQGNFEESEGVWNSHFREWQKGCMGASSRTQVGIDWCSHCGFALAGLWSGERDTQSVHERYQRLESVVVYLTLKLLCWGQ